ncbi:MAG: D-amino-acid transaminase [Proteobacteria bacterium]|nr:D-amino-acid transaminase [Pseudomonadota bacterium]MBU6425512.1 D-amino-acid transaminase [Rhodospirillales bacterium]
MARIAYVNGRYLPLTDATVNIEDRGYQFGDGIYEVFYAYRGRLMDETLHFARLERSRGEIGLASPMGAAALRVVIHELMRRNRVETGLVYLQLTRGVAKRDHVFPGPVPRPALTITVRPKPEPPEALDGWSAGAITLADERWGRCDIKSINLLPNVLAREAAKQAVALEAILFDKAGMVTEGASSSVWIVGADNVLRTRGLDQHVLPGCTRAAVLEDVATEGLDFREEAFSLEALRQAREVFITSATSFVKPITALDGVPVGNGAPGLIANRLYARYLARLKEG